MTLSEPLRALLVTRWRKYRRYSPLLAPLRPATWLWFWKTPWHFDRLWFFPSHGNNDPFVAINNQRIVFLSNWQSTWVPQRSVWDRAKTKWHQPTLAASVSNSLPIVVRSRHKHSRLSSSSYLNNILRHWCINLGPNMFNLNNSPMNLWTNKKRQSQRKVRLLSLAASTCVLRYHTQFKCRGVITHLIWYKLWRRNPKELDFHSEIS